VGLNFLEMGWLRMTGNERIDRYFSSYIHYVFTKSASHLSDPAHP
jgi:protoporphyrinogen oxidase